MALENIMWTVLPNGSEGHTLNFSLYLSPQLSPDGHLGAFPNFANWAARCRDLSVLLEIPGLSQFPTKLRLDVPRPDLWAALFPTDTPVKAYASKDQTGRTIQSFPASQVHKQVLDLYNHTATKPALAQDHPPLDGANDVSKLINSLGSQMREMLDTRQQQQKADPNNQWLDNSLVKEFRLSPEPLYKAWRFFNRPRGTVDPKTYVAPPPKIPDWDFHQVVAMLVDHGSLLRLLGLVVDGSIEVPDGITIPASSQIRVAKVQLAGGTTPDASRPWTHFVHSSNPVIGFLPAPAAGGETISQMLKLGDSKLFDVFEVDIDGAALKTLDFAVNLNRLQEKTAGQKADKPESAALPALRTGGITVARIDRGSVVKNGFAVTKTRSAAPDSAQLYAEDVTRGYRVDVLFRGQWYSLCQRVGQILVGPPDKALPVEVKDEGYVKGPSGSSSVTPGVTVDELYLHEAMFTWKGWSMVATRPGRTLPLVPATEPVRHTNQAGTKFQLVTDFHAKPHTLPRLRFGEHYRLRARAVDLAGNSLPLDAAIPGTGWESPDRRYLRYEPVPSPVLVPPATFREGEALENVTIRSQVEHSHPHLPDALFNPDNARHVLPPKAAQQLAEEHGLFDGLFVTDPGLAFRMSCKEQGSLLDRQIVDPYNTSFDPNVFPAKLVDVSDIALVDPTRTPPVEIPSSEGGKWPAHRGDPLPIRESYVIHKGKTVALPYLPDPLARGLALKFPGGALQFQPFEGHWPDAKPFRIQLASGPLSFTAMADGNVLITIPRGTMLALRYSSLIDAAGLDVLAFGQNLPTALAGLATLGQHWMLTPYRTLTLVHAVEQPVTDPIIAMLSPNKERGKTYAQFRGSVKTHSQSTAEVDIMGRWTDPVDRLSDDGPTTEDHDGLAFSRRIGYSETVASLPAASNDKVVLPRHEFGDTKHRLVKYRCIGTTRYREYFPASVTGAKENITREGPDFGPVNILSSARPEVPRVLYVVPTFGWDVSADGHTHKRVGRGLRIYLDRPWYSSGADERLGILLAHTPSSPDAMEPIRHYVSEWGVDPTTDNTPPTTELLSSHFTNQTITPLDNVAVAEKPELLVQVLRFPVEYNAERKLWFCDIQMDPGPYYYPFVRLAIVRVQADSVISPEDLRLSRVVKTEFAQLTADRAATVTASAKGVDITVSGLTARNEVGQPPVIVRAPAVSATPVVTPIDVVTPTVPVQIFTANPQAGAGHLVRAHIERRPAGSPTTKPDGKDHLGWETVGSEIDLPSYTSGTLPQVYWRASMLWTDRSSAYVYRMVIREFELHHADQEVSSPGLASYSKDGAPIAARLVYLDTIPLTP